MTALLVVLAAWFALSVPVALVMGRFIRVGQTHAPETVPTTNKPVPAIEARPARLPAGTVAVHL